MLALQPLKTQSRIKVLCLGAHSDDIEIGCAGLLLHWLSRYRQVEVDWVVLSAVGERAAEARRSARALLRGAHRLDVVLGDFPESHLPAHFSAVKDFLSAVAIRREPDIVLTHRLDDRHQDHRLIGEIAWQTWRDHLLLEYEIPKYEGDLGTPNIYVPLTRAQAALKVRHLMKYFSSQRSKTWFSASTFESLLRLRGIECRADSGLAEAFHGRKLRF